MVQLPDHQDSLKPR